MGLVFMQVFRYQRNLPKKQLAIEDYAKTNLLISMISWLLAILRTLLLNLFVGYERVFILL